MKKFLAIVLVGYMLSSLVACGADVNVSDTNDNTSEQINANCSTALNEMGVVDYKGDNSYFTPSTSDYIYLVGDDGSEDIQHTLLISFDNNGKAVQFVHKVYDKASGGDYSGENYIQEEDAWYKNLTSEEIGYALSDSRWSDKYSVLYDISKGEAYYEGLNCSKYHVSQKLTENQTKIENIHTINDFQYMSAMPLATEDYRITEKSDRTEVEEKIQDWDLMIRDMDSEYNMATVPVRMYNAFSYKTIYVSCFDTNGKMVESAEAYVFDTEEMVEDFLKYSFGVEFSIEGVDPADQSVREATFTNEAQAKANEMYEIKGNLVIYRVANDSDDEYSYKQMGSTNLARDEVDNGEKCYYSIPYLTNSQIKQVINQ